MDATAIKALKASIRHWENNLAAVSPDKAEIFSDACPLCFEFLRDGEVCFGCPIRQTTHKHLCKSTPWEEAKTALTNWKYSVAHPPQPAIFEATKERWLKAAQAELDFLKSLLPEGEA